MNLVGSECWHVLFEYASFVPRYFLDCVPKNVLMVKIEGSDPADDWFFNNVCRVVGA